MQVCGCETDRISRALDNAGMMIRAICFTCFSFGLDDEDDAETGQVVERCVPGTL